VREARRSRPGPECSSAGGAAFTSRASQIRLSVANCSVLAFATRILIRIESFNIDIEGELTQHHWLEY